MFMKIISMNKNIFTYAASRECNRHLRLDQNYKHRDIHLYWQLKVSKLFES